MYHAQLSGVPNDVALNHCGQSGTEHFVCISSADGTDYAVTVKNFVCTSFADGTDSAVTVVYANYRRLASGAHVRQMEGDDSPYQTY